MKPMIIPMTDVLASHRLAALRIQEMRRAGIPCHLEEKADRAGHYLEVVYTMPHQAITRTAPSEAPVLTD